MSLETWKKEFMPITAKAAASGTWEAVVQHSLTKWEGLRPEHIKEHDLKNPFAILGSEGCSLCQRIRLDYGNVVCGKCPLYEVLDRSSCDAYGNSPYVVFCDTENPEPMIEALKAALVLVKTYPDGDWRQE